MGNLIAATMVATQQLLSSFLVMFDDIPTKHEKKAPQVIPNKCNISPRYGRPTTSLQANTIFEHTRQDDDRA